MSRYRMDDGTIIDTDNAKATWGEEKDWNGNNMIGRSSRSQWHAQTLRRSRKGRFYIEHSSSESGVMDRAEWISNHAAVAWLILNEHDVPEDLSDIVDAVSE